MSSRGREVTRVLRRSWATGVVRSRFFLSSGSRRREAFACSLRHGFEELGPAFIKIGQLVSVRPDVFSSELVFEMSRLRDSVIPIPFEDVVKVIEAEFAAPVDELFVDLEPEPVASASIAQVHRARLAEEARPAWGPALPARAPIAVKVVKPGVFESIEGDLELGRRAIRWMHRLGFARRLDMAVFVDELEESLSREVDMRVEGRTADRFAFDFRDDPLIRVPRVVWNRTTRQVLTMEYLEGWRLSELDAAIRLGIDVEGLARHGAVAFMKQVLVHGRFHADLHPANLFVTTDGRIVYLDFGIVGHLGLEEREAVTEILAAIVGRDPEAALRHAEDLGLEIRPEHRETLTRDLHALMDETLDRERDIRHFGMGLLTLLRRHRVRVPIGFGLLVKALVTVEGVARALHPEIDMVETARPFVSLLLGPRRLYSSASAALRLPDR